MAAIPSIGLFITRFIRKILAFFLSIPVVVSGLIDDIFVFGGLTMLGCGLYLCFSLGVSLCVVGVLLMLFGFLLRGK